MTVKTQEQIKTDLIDLFNINSKPNSKQSNGKFFIDKREFEREVVVSKLKKYLNEFKIEDGYCEVRSMTLMYTVFEIKDGTPYKL